MSFLGFKIKGIRGSGGILGGGKGIVTPQEEFILGQFPNAAQAWSLNRKLKPDYSGDLFRVRRSSDNATLDIPLAGNEVNETALTDFVGANDGFIVTVYDQSGNSLDYTNGTASQQPQIVSAGTVLKNNGKLEARPVDGDSQLFSSLSGSANTWTFSVLQRGGVAANGSILWQETGTGSKFVLVEQSGSSSTTVSGGLSTVSPLYYANGVELVTPTRAQVATATTSQTIFVNGTNDVAFANIQLGYDQSSSFSMYRMQEHIVYHTDQTANRTAIEAALNSYYSAF